MKQALPRPKTKLHADEYTPMTDPTPPEGITDDQIIAALQKQVDTDSDNLLLLMFDAMDDKGFVDDFVEENLGSADPKQVDAIRTYLRQTFAEHGEKRRTHDSTTSDR